MPELIDIDQYVDRLRRGLNDCVEFQTRYGLGWEDRASDEELEKACDDELMKRYDKGEFSANITKEEANHALEALDFFSGAKDFLASMGHEISFYTLEEEDKNNGVCGFYTSLDGSHEIHIPVEKDASGQYNPCLMNKKGGLRNASTMSHEILHAVDHFAYLMAADSIPVTIGAEADTERFLYAAAQNSYAALEMGRFLEKNCNATRDEWEKETASAFKINLERPGYSDYKGKFVKEVVPRLAESKFIHDDLTPQINDITSPNNQALTYHVMHSYQQHLKRLGEDAQIPLSLQGEGEFLESCTEMLGDIAVGMSHKAAPQLKPPPRLPDEDDVAPIDTDYTVLPPAPNLIDMDDTFELMDNVASVRNTVRDSVAKQDLSNDKKKPLAQEKRMVTMR